MQNPHHVLPSLESTPLDLATCLQPWIEKVIRGVAIAAFAMTGFEAGSDVGIIRTPSERLGNSSILEEEPSFLSNEGTTEIQHVLIGRLLLDHPIPIQTTSRSS